jgi:hypothetical protein
MKTWTKPEYQLIDMNAEIGSYQEDFGEEGRDPGAAGAKAEGAVGEGPEPAVATAARDDQGGIPAGGASV